MKKLYLTLTLFLFFLVSSSTTNASTRVNGYYRKNGTYVQPYYRSSPDGIFSNNWSAKGNINPYTGKEGTQLYPGSTNNNYSSGNSYYPSNSHTYESNCPLNSTYNSLSNKCNCIEGYTIDSTGTACSITVNDDCKNKFGENTYYNYATKSCQCSTNYLYDKNSSKCIEGNQWCANAYSSESAVFNALTQNCQYCSNGMIIDPQNINKCICKSGSYWDQKNKTCSPIPSCGINENITKNYTCECEKGYVRDESNSCVAGEEYCASKFGTESAFFNEKVQNCSYCTGGSILTKDKKGCVCKQGYRWSKNRLNCVK